jgi:malate/lactate dehydrogenase
VKIGLWGAGAIGQGIAYRLVMSPACTELAWINRDPTRIRNRVVDLEQGLAFSPSCWRVRAHDEEQGVKRLGSIELFEAKCTTIRGERGDS